MLQLPEFGDLKPCKPLWHQRIARRSSIAVQNSRSSRNAEFNVLIRPDSIAVQNPRSSRNGGDDPALDLGECEVEWSTCLRHGRLALDDLDHQSRRPLRRPTLDAVVHRHTHCYVLPCSMSRFHWVDTLGHTSPTKLNMHQLHGHYRKGPEDCDRNFSQGTSASLLPD